MVVVRLFRVDRSRVPFSEAANVLDKTLNSGRHVFNIVLLLPFLAFLAYLMSFWI